MVARRGNWLRRGIWGAAALALALAALPFLDMGPPEPEVTEIATFSVEGLH